VDGLATGFVACATLAALAGAAAADQPAIVSARAGADGLERHDTLGIDLELTGGWQNPFDPDQVAVDVEVTTPTGRRIVVPAYYHEPRAASVRPASEKRREVRFLKLFITEEEWPEGFQAEFFIDDLRLLHGGREAALADMEGDLSDWALDDGLAPSEELAHGGRRSLRFAPQIDLEESWPGAVLAIRGADWSEFDGISLWLYPRMAWPGGPVMLYFQAEDGARSPIRRWRPEQLMPGEWQELRWDWRGFGPDVRFAAAGEPGWRAHLTPSEVGPHAWAVTVRTPEGTARSAGGTFDVTASERPGFVRVSAEDPHYFAFDNGEGFFPIGHDVIWSGAGGPLAEAMAYFPKMQAHGENCTYLIMGALDAFPPRLAIEWTELGRYDQDAAAAVDYYLDLARRHGIYLKLSFDVHAHNIRTGRPGLWEQNPYSAERGGPCTGPNEFFTNAEAIEHYKKRLRYIVARWGHRPEIMAWESFAEINGAVEEDGRTGWRYGTEPGHEETSRMLAAWLAETSDCLRAIDPYDHLISVSFGSDGSDDRLWALPQIDYTQIHHYGSADTAPQIARWCRTLTERYAKPMMVTEFGWGVQAIDLGVDPQGLCNHNGIWAGVMSGAAGGPQNWWCRRIDQLDLYHQYRALRDFTRGIDWTREGFRHAEIRLEAPAHARLPSVTLPAAGPFSGGTVGEFTVNRDGSVNDPGQVPSHLLAPDRPEEHMRPTFHVNYPVDGEFVVRVDSVSPDARLDVYVDGEPALAHELPAHGAPALTSIFDERWQIWRGIYDREFAVPVSAGRHAIRLENGKPGSSWIRIASYELTNYDPEPVRAFGLMGRETTILWFQNKLSTWGNDRRGRQPGTIRRAAADVAVPGPGDYRIEWWDTWAGEVMRTEQAATANGRLALRLPAFDRDVACRITRAP
jgi:hypothetical protein